MNNNNRYPNNELDYNTYLNNEYRDINNQYPFNEDTFGINPNNDMYRYPFDENMNNWIPNYDDFYGRYPVNNGGYPMNNSMNPPYNDMNSGYQMNEYLKRNSCYCVKSYLRILNALVDGPSLDVYVNELQIASNLKFGEFSRYVLFNPGNYRFTAYQSGTTNTPILVTDIVINRNLSYTGVIAGELTDLAEISVFMIPEEKENADMNRMAALRLINLGINTPSLDLILDDGTILIYGLQYGDTSNNIAIPAENYTLYLRETNGTTDILAAPKVDLAPKMHYTLFVIGRYGDSPRIELIIPDDGVNYLDIC